PSIAQCRFQGLPQRHNLLMQRAVTQWLGSFSDCFLVSMHSVFLGLAGSFLRDGQFSEERQQPHARTPVLSVHVLLVASSVRDDVVLAKVLFRYFVEGLSLLISPARSFPRRCKY